MRICFDFGRERGHLLGMGLAILLSSTLVGGTAWGNERDEEGLSAQHGQTVGGAGDVPLAPGYTSLGFEVPEPGSYRLPTIKKAPSGEVLLESGEAVELSTLFDDRYVLLSFIYTSCNDVNGCPLATFVMDRLHQRVQEEPTLEGQVRLLTLSFDPGNDSPEVMSLYRKTFTEDQSSWKFLTTDSQEALAPILEAYGQSVNPVYNESGQISSHFSHVLRVYLIDTRGRIRNIYNVDFLHPELLVADLQTLRLEGEGEGAGGKAERRPPSLPWGDMLIQGVEDLPLGLPALPQNRINELTPERVDLGRKLFRDQRLSSNGVLSCASCHKPQQGFSQNSAARAVGVEGRSLRRNSSSLLNIAYQDRLFWDGREFSLSSLIWTKLLDERALGNRSVGEVLQRLRADSELESEFEVVFGNGIDLETVASALSAYLTTLVSGGSRFDRWYFGDEEPALTAEEQEGFELFRGRAGCVTCHTIESDHALFMDQDLHNTGLGWEHSQGLRSRRDTVEVAGRTIELNLEALSGTEARDYNDLGLYEVTQDPADRWRFRTPTLRDVERTGPYMHDGSIQSLERVVRYYERGGVPHTLQADAIEPFDLDPSERNALVAFLKSLTGRYLDTRP